MPEISERPELIAKKKNVKLEEMPANAGLTTAGNPHTKIMGRGKGGKFVSMADKTIDSKAITRYFREQMVKIDSETGLNDFQECYLSMLYIIKIAQGSEDAKVMMAAVKAFEAVTNRVWGRANPSDEELENRANTGVRVIVLNQQPAEKSLEVPKEQKKLPSFAEVVSVETNGGDHGRG